MQEKGFEISNNILHFIHNDSDYLINLDLLETLYLYQDQVVFVEYGKVKSVPSEIFDITELAVELLRNHNYMVCGSKHVVNLNLVNSVHIVRQNDEKGLSDKYNLMLIFNNRTKKEITLNSWREAEKLYHQIDDKLIEIKTNNKLGVN